MRVLLLIALLAGCADPGVLYRDAEPAPGGGGPYGGDGTIDMVAVYFSFDIDGESHGDMGSHCGFSDWTLDPATVLLHIGNGTSPAAVVMRQIHPEQSTQGIAHFGTAPTALWRDHELPRAFGPGSHGPVVFGDGTASFAGIQVPADRWMLVDRPYMHESGGQERTVTETLHMRYFPDAPVALDREQRMCM